MYLLDTDTFSYLVKRNQNVLDKFNGLHPSQILISSVSVFEIETGLKRNAKANKKFRPVIESFLSSIRVIDFDRRAAIQTADIFVDLEKRGQKIGSYDLQNAGIARAWNLTLVTNNTREYARVKNLKLENWV
jgi:tRNA(fMet)-specific endonuclease VapC